MSTSTRLPEIVSVAKRLSEPRRSEKRIAPGVSPGSGVHTFRKAPEAPEAPEGPKILAGGKREARSPRKGACVNKPRRGGRHQIEIRDKDKREQNSCCRFNNGPKRHQ